MSDAGAGTPQYIRGVPHPLPAGERLLWEGAPDTRAIATHVFHWRLIAGYFAAMLALWAFTTELSFGSQDFLASLSMRIGLSLLVLAIVLVLSKVVANTSWYAITSQRVVLRVGMVLPMSINVPFTILESAGLGMFRDKSGQVALRLTPGNRLAYIALWPHCRVFRITQPEPVLRGLTDAARVGDILATAVADAANADARINRRRERHADAVGVPQPAGA
jgi:hypothetical protein